MSESPQNKTSEKEVVSKIEITTEENSAVDDKLKATVSKLESVATSEEMKEEHNKVDGLMIAFWHGVAAVLIGEASALLVALAWAKIRGGKDGK